jgi:hypothetical protein
VSDKQAKIIITAEVAAAEANLKRLAATGKGVSDRLGGDFETLGLRSSYSMLQQRTQVESAYKRILASGQVTGRELVRVEQAKAKAIEDIDREMFGAREGMLAGFKKNWVGITAAFAAGAVVIAKGWDAISEGAEAAQKKAAFENLARSHGQSADSILDSLNRVSAGTIATTELMEKAGTAMLTGIPAEKLAGLMEIARASSRITGQTITKSFEDISLATARQSKMILDNLGIIVNVEQANEEYARSIGKVATQLTDADKKQAFMNATMKAGEDIVRRVGTGTVTSAEQTQQFTAALSDLGTEIKKIFASQPVMDGINALTDGIIRLRQAIAPTSSESLDQLGVELQAVNEQLEQMDKIPAALKIFYGGEEGLQQRKNELLAAYRELVEANRQAFKSPTDDGGGNTGIPEAVQKVIDKLREEQAQLGRTATEQRVYNELKAAGVDISSKYGQQIAAMVRSLAETKPMDAKEWNAILGRQEIDDAIAAVTQYRARLKFEPPKEEKPSFGLGDYDLAGGASDRIAGADQAAAEEIAAAERFAILQQSLASETELIQSEYWNRQSIADENRQRGLISEREYSAVMVEITRERDKQLADIEWQLQQQKMTAWQNGTSAFMNLSNALYAFSGKKSKELFTLNKVAGIADGVVNTAVGVTQALRSVPYPFNLVAAASVAAAGAAQIAAISSQTFGGGGTSPAAGGYGGGTPDSPIVTQPSSSQQTSSQSITVVIQGNVLGEEKYIEERFAPLMRELASRNVDFGFERTV